MKKKKDKEKKEKGFDVMDLAIFRARSFFNGFTCKAISCSSISFRLFEFNG